MIIDGELASESKRMRTLISLERDEGPLESIGTEMILRRGRWYVNYGAVCVEVETARALESEPA